MPVAILQADVTAAAEILALQKLAYQSEAALYQDWSIPPLTETLEKIEADFSNSTFLVACHSGRIIGSVRASLDGGTCSIGRLIVDPAYQGRGIGRRLMLEVEAIFPATDRFELFTGDRSVRNIRLYEGLGYRTFRTESLSPQVTLVLMEKRRQETT